MPLSKGLTVALIPARSGSKRIPGKNLKALGGKPLVVWSIETTLALELPCYVSTDSEEIAAVSHSAGAQIIWRPTEFCSDEATDDAVISHAQMEIDAKLIVYLRPTTPFRDSQVVWNAIRFMQLNEEYSLLRSVQEMDESPFKCVYEGKDGVIRPVPWHGDDCTDWPNQDCPRGLNPNGYIDIVRGSWGGRRYWYETEKVVELDTPEQWEFAEWKIERRINDKAVN